MNGRTASQPRDYVQQGLLRTPTVEDALQYSPFTSVVPFSPDVVPLPHPIPSALKSALTSKGELELASHTLRTLNAQASNPNIAPKHFKDTLQNLQHFLKSDNLTHLRFKSGISAGRSKAVMHENTLARLQPFPKMIMDSTNLSYRYPTPVSPMIRGKDSLHSFTKNGSVSVSLTQVSKTSATQRQASDFVIVHQESSSLLAEDELVPRVSQGKPAVIIPDLPPSSDPTQYQKFPEIDAAILQASGATSSRRNSSTAVHLHTTDTVRGTRVHSDVLLNNLQELIVEILEAEDNVDHASLGPDTNEYFSSECDSGMAGFVLLPDVQNRLDRSLTLVIDAGRFRDVTSEHLARLQKLFAAPLMSATSAQLSLPESLDEDVLETWSTQLHLAHNGLRASTTLLKMMTAERDDEQVLSEETLQLVLNHLKSILDSCLVPTVERRSSTSQESASNPNSDQLKLLGAILQRAGNVLKLLGSVISRFELSETSITSIEFLVLQLIFVENGPSEKESLLGIQKFEAVRRHAMDVVAKIFLRLPEHRRYIIDEILSSLEKLPVTRQNARHFKIMDGKPIQLVSALVMQLIQTSAIGGTKREQNGVESVVEDDSLDEEEDDSQRASPTTTSAARSWTQKPQISKSDMDRDSIAYLLQLAGPLFDAAHYNSSYVANYLIQRALRSTKSGDQPYRNLLDIFTEDFIGVLGSPDWPAAELLLRALLSNLVGITEKDKGGAPAKNMALDIMGVMGSGIADMRNHVFRMSQNSDLANSGSGKSLARLCEDVLEGNNSDTELLNHDGACRAVAEYYQGVDLGNLHMQSARVFFLVQWARRLSSASEVTKEAKASNAILNSHKITAQYLVKTIVCTEKLAADDHFADIAASEIRLFYALNILSMPFCNAFRRVVSILLTSLSSSHATVRSRSLKSVVQLLEQDATILDRFSNVLKHIKHCASDSSPLVRDSALSLLGKCMSLKPSLESEICHALVPKLSDSAIGVRKRAMKLLKDIYLRNHSTDLRATIADALTRYVADTEESVSELARSILEEIWFAPFYSTSAIVGSSVEAKHNIKLHTSLIISAVSRSSNVLLALEVLLSAILKDTSKNAAANRIVSTCLVAALFDDIIDNDGGSEYYAQQDIFQVLTVFAKSHPHLFTAEQMLTLKPYIQDLAKTDDVHVYRSVLIIYISVLPVLPPLQHDFLLSVQTALLANIPRLRRPALEELAACLWIIDGVLRNTEKLVRLMLSVLEALECAKRQDLSGISEETRLTSSRVLRYLSIAGSFGKTCNLDSRKVLFKDKFSFWKGDSVSGLVVDIICPFSSRQQPLLIREAALDNMCLVCHTNPGNFIKPQVTKAISEALAESNDRLKLAILSGIQSFYKSEEERSKSGTEIAIGEGIVHGAERLGKSMMLSDNDGATTSIAQQYLPSILRIALSRSDDLALVATQVIASTNRQGLVHPKETGPALVALGTASNPMIAEIAKAEHRNLHAKHESMLEKEYLNAIEQTFTYQRQTVRSLSGLDPRNLPKLHGFYEVIKTGSAVSRKKFLANICARIDIDLKKSKSVAELEAHLLFTRFVLENLSFLEYGRADELLHLLKCMEKIFARTGNIVTQAFEASTDLQLQAQSEAPISARGGLASRSHDHLRQLTTHSMVLSMIWETRKYLRKAWGLQTPREGKQKPAAKELNKPLTKSNGVIPEHHVEEINRIMASLDSEESMLKQCQAFMDLFSVDNELRVDSDEADEAKSIACRYDTPFEDTDGDPDTTPKMVAGSGRGTKRKPSLSARSTPSKPRKRGRPSLGPTKRTGSRGMDEGEDEDGWN